MKVVNPAKQNQVLEIISRIATQTPWGKIESNFLQKEFINLSPAAFSEKMLNFFSMQMIVSDCPPVWRTIKLGTGLKTAHDFCEALKTSGMFISDTSGDILRTTAFMVAPEEMEINLVVVSNAELGFKDGAKLRKTYARARELGLNLCPSEVGPQLRLQYKDQPNGEGLLVAMESISDSYGFRRLFNIECEPDGCLFLGGYDGRMGNVWNADKCFVFSLPDKIEKN